MSEFKQVHPWGRLYEILNKGAKTAQHLLQRRKQRAHRNLKTMSVTRKEKLKWKRKSGTHPFSRAPSGVEDKPIKSNFSYPAAVQQQAVSEHTALPISCYRTNIAVKNNPR